MKMRKSKITITMDAMLKEQTERILNSMGLTMSGAFNLLACQIVNQHRIPFEIIDVEEPNAETLEAIRESEEILANPGAYKGYKNLDEMFKDLET